MHRLDESLLIGLLSNIETMEPEWSRVVVISTGRTLLSGWSERHETNLNREQSLIATSLSHLKEVAGEIPLQPLWNHGLSESSQDFEKNLKATWAWKITCLWSSTA
jgi:hypothetical protein